MRFCSARLTSIRREKREKREKERPGGSSTIPSPCNNSTSSSDIPDEINATSPLLFVDTRVLASHMDLKLKVHKPARGDRILWPTEPWEDWGVFACNSVVQLAPTDANYSVDTTARMYYVCVESAPEEISAAFDWKNHTNTTKIVGARPAWRCHQTVSTRSSPSLTSFHITANRATSLPTAQR